MNMNNDKNSIDVTYDDDPMAFVDANDLRISNLKRDLIVITTTMLKKTISGKQLLCSKSIHRFRCLVEFEIISHSTAIDLVNYSK